MPIVEETLYSLRKTTKGFVRLAKWEGRQRPSETYSIIGVKCDCLGSLRTPHCKHVQILEKFRAFQASQHISWVGVFYDFDRDIFYVPADGEGIPIVGFCDIEAMVPQELLIL